MAEFASVTPRATQLHRRLLLDIDELTRKSYPNIHVHAGDDLDQLCLVLSPPGWPRMHLQVTQLQGFPMRPPRIQMDTCVNHPNIFESYICATILNDDRYFTPAYTLKGIAIQLLSFFGSDRIEQAHGGGVIDLEDYRQNQEGMYYDEPFAACERCGFAIESAPTNKCGVSRYRDAAGEMQSRQDVAPSALALETPNKWTLLGMEREKAMEREKEMASHGESRRSRRRRQQQPSSKGSDANADENGRPGAIHTLPNELLLEVLEALDDFEDLTSLARAWPRISALITEHDVIRRRELQCFVTKQTYRDAGVKLGVGVSTSERGELSSEFELLSQQAFALPVRMSVQNIPFTRWLPLPLSPRHWAAVRHNAQTSLSLLQGYVKLPSPTHAQVLYSFMNDIVVKLNLVDAEDPKPTNRSYGRDYGGHTRIMLQDTAPASSLEHASEKAIESYFHLFHLLVCLATEHPDIVREADTLISTFLAGRRDKTHCPNLGHLLVALLVSSVPVTDALRRAIITEAITRNVVWLLNPARGRGNRTFPELAYLEPDAVSAYRLDRTFQGSRTSYRLLMFSELFRRTARPAASSTSLAQVRDDLFRRHGAPPRGAAAHLAGEVRRLHAINDFPAFLREMGLSRDQIPTPAQFTGVLRGTVEASMKMGYSRWALAQSDALALRLAKGCEPGVGIRPELAEMVANAMRLPQIPLKGVSFFPEKNQVVNGAGRGGGNRGGRRGSGGGGVVVAPAPPGMPWATLRPQSTPTATSADGAAPAVDSGSGDVVDGGVGAAQPANGASPSPNTTTSSAPTADAGAGRGSNHQGRGGITLATRTSLKARRGGMS